MFDKYMVLTRGFQNVSDNGQITGFQMKVRIAYYRGVFLALLGGFEVTVDGETFKPEQLRFTIGDHTYTMDELAKEERARWPFGEPATLTIHKPGGLKPGGLKPGGLKPGLHEVEVVETVNPAYVPKGVFVGRTRRKITLVA
jgi:hypothetical protein